MIITRELNINFEKTTVGTEWSYHQLSPYIGKIKSSIAKFLVENFTNKSDTIFDPFCGAGTIPFEAWVLGRHVIANDLNRYALILTHAKLFPPNSIEDIFADINKFDLLIAERKKGIDLRKIPKWVRSFYHKETLRETIAWFELLEEHKSYFLQACLLGILHHQRPGFLSYPASHTVPYLRIKKFPLKKFPHLYSYRSVKDRLVAKVKRAHKRIPVLDHATTRICHNLDASKIIMKERTIDAIITSPPYMRQLDYARDNRLRLWFLNVKSYRELDEKISPKEMDFIKIMKECLIAWKEVLKDNGKCVLFVGDNFSRKYRLKLPEIIEQIALYEVGDYKLIFKHESIIPTKRRVRRNYSGNKSETILVFQKCKSNEPQHRK